MEMCITPLRPALAGVCLVWVPPANAQMTNDLTIDNPKAMALDNAATTDEIGTDPVHCDPAALTRMKSRRATVKLLTGVMDIRVGFKAPPNYGEGTFGLCDDPIVNNRSRILTPTIYLPGLGDMTDAPLLVIPLAGISINPPGPRFTFATNVYTPQALGHGRGSDSDPAHYQGREASLQWLTYFSPTPIYQVNDELSAGLSMGSSRQAVTLNEDFRVLNQLLGLLQQTKEIGYLSEMQEILEVFFDVCGGNIGSLQNLVNIDLDMQQSLSPSSDLGVLWEPTDQFTWGATYQSEPWMRLKGKYWAGYGQDWQGLWVEVRKLLGGAILGWMLPYGNVDEEHGNAAMNAVYPDAFSTGAKLRPFKKQQFNFSLKWNGYSDWDEFKIEFDRELDLLRIVKYLDSKDAISHSTVLDHGYHDTWSQAMGVQYDVSDRLQLRAGYGYRPSAVPGGQMDTLVLISDVNLYGLGLDYQWDKGTVIDVGFNCFVIGQSVKADASCNLSCTGLDNLVYNSCAGLNVDTTMKVYIFAMTYRTTF